MRRLSILALCLLAFAAFAVPATAQEDVGSSTPTFKEGDVISYDTIGKLKNFLPPEFWSNRDFFFYEGMQLVEVGPFHLRDYSPRPTSIVGATERYKGPGPHRSRRQPRELHRRAMPFDTMDTRSTARTTPGRREDHVELRLRSVGGDGTLRLLLLLLLGPRRAAAALLRGHRRASTCPTATSPT